MFQFSLRLIRRDNFRASHIRWSLCTYSNIFSAVINFDKFLYSKKFIRLRTVHNTYKVYIH